MNKIAEMMNFLSRHDDRGTLPPPLDERDEMETSKVVRISGLACLPTLSLPSAPALRSIGFLISPLFDHLFPAESSSRSGHEHSIIPASSGDMQE